MATTTTRAKMICLLNGQAAELLQLDADTTGEEVRSLSSVKPDARWQFTDANGHFHAYDDKNETPTLRTEAKSYWCEDCLDHHKDYTSHCRLCDEEIQPRTIDEGPTSTWIAGPTEWTLHVAGQIPYNRDGMSVHIADSVRGEMFGIVYPTSQTFSSDEGIRSVLSGHLWKRK